MTVRVGREGHPATQKSRHGFARRSAASRWTYGYCIDAIGNFGGIDMAIEPGGSPKFTNRFARAAAGTAKRGKFVTFLRLTTLLNL